MKPLVCCVFMEWQEHYTGAKNLCEHELMGSERSIVTPASRWFR
jgi:hypothetical protein